MFSPQRMSQTTLKPLVLASTSPYRAEQLARLGLAFTPVNPATDETPQPLETAAELVERLSIAKARSVANAHPGALIIGSDQVAERDGTVLGKPGTRDAAIDQLTRSSGRSVAFHTGVCVLDAASGEFQVDRVLTLVRFRSLSDVQIQQYLDRESALDCAGSFKSEGLGISLFQSVYSDDPSALMGIPLISLVTLLEAAGAPVL